VLKRKSASPVRNVLTKGAWVKGWVININSLKPSGYDIYQTGSTLKNFTLFAQSPFSACVFCVDRTNSAYCAATYIADCRVETEYWNVIHINLIWKGRVMAQACIGARGGCAIATYSHVFIFWVGRDSSVGIATELRAGKARGLNPGGVEIFRKCPDRPWVPPSLLCNGYRVFPGVKSGRGVKLTPHPLLVPWSRKGRAIPLFHLWSVRPVRSLSAYTRVTFTFTAGYYSSNKYILCRNLKHVLFI